MNKKAQLDYFVIWIFRIFVIMFVFFSVVNFAKSRLNNSYDFSDVRGQFLINRLLNTPQGIAERNYIYICNVSKLITLTKQKTENYKILFESDFVSAEIAIRDLDSKSYDRWQFYYLNKNHFDTYFPLYGITTKYAFAFDRRFCMLDYGAYKHLGIVATMLIYPKDY